MRKFLAAVALAGAISGCAGTSFDYSQARQVKVGMTEAEVVQIMGRPYSVVSRGDEQMWVWSHANVFAGSKAVSFKMKGGKVIETPSIPSSF
ncbi:Beta-barrel assembly machine subunit BamE [Pseudomonas duriflava]|uniref:Beta-barrel assembly machine subunit BamE n=1 Tax=Pseudomonas duriflava TaxID=459528 RepID=A0A562Q899_9PSED|nr:outer membrane protein assembly factor BamE [Pseudomonas duriflava]TWI52985.1 Beta-barrel assembly machine subunit BamE [Pseudomonas duriflava]